MADHEALFDSLTEFARTLVGRYAIADVLYRLTDQVVPAFDLHAAGVSVGDADGTLRFVTASTDEILEVEKAQERFQQGPCASAFETCAVVTVENLEADSRWPEYAPIAISAGFCAVAAIPLRAADGCIGSLNLYSRAIRAWEEDELEQALLFADIASSYVANASDLQRSERVREQLQQALDSRIEIEQAKGMIAAHQGLTIDQAYDKLRSYTRGHNASLHEVANAVVNLGLELS
jgi:GAF domain-containing protein